MISEQPRYLSQGVNYLGFLAQQLGDLRGSKTLAHELIQNADDAKDDSGNLAATQITFDITDEALVVSNDAVFRETDFTRMKEVASGSKRNESGARTTGAFGVGFISVYQITDRPEIHSAGRRWVLRPDEIEGRRIEEWLDTSIAEDTGTLFRLPWAFEESRVRKELKAPTVNSSYIESFIEELETALPKAILFLKKLERIELRRNGEIVSWVERTIDSNEIIVECDQEYRLWRVFTGDFSNEAHNLRNGFAGHIDQNRSSYVKVAVPDSFIKDGLLYATLPTEQASGLPFHIDADFFPSADRKSIQFGDSLDFRSEWNRAALRAAAAAVASNLIAIRDVFKGKATIFWRVIDDVYAVHRNHLGSTRMPLGAFWEALLPTLSSAPIVFTESGKWLAPGQTHILTGREEESAVPAFSVLGFETVHHSLASRRNILTNNSVGVKGITVEDICNALRQKGLSGQSGSAPSEFQDPKLLNLLWRGIYAVLENTQGELRIAAEAKLRECALALGIDGRLWPCRSVFRSDEDTRQLFTPLLTDNTSFLVEENVPLLELLCPSFESENAIAIVEESVKAEDLETDWRRGDFDPKTLLQWFDANKASLDDSLRENLAELRMFPSTQGLYPLKDLWLPGGFDDPLGVTELLDAKSVEGLVDFLRSLGVRKLTFNDYARDYISEAFADNSTVSTDTKRELLEILERHIGEIRDNGDLRSILSRLNIVECSDGMFRQPDDVYFPSDDIMSTLEGYASFAKISERSEGRRDLYDWLGVADCLRLKDLLRVIRAQTAEPPNRKSRAIVSRMLEVLGTAWPNLDAVDREFCEQLKSMYWLPAEDDAKSWHKPDELYAAYRKSLFASQAEFIDITLLLQQRISNFLRYLGINLNPQPLRVIRHLLRCCEQNVRPPGGVYQWLNDNAGADDLKQLKEATCLWVEDRYFSPKQVYWGSHPFGRFRVQLGSDLRSYQKFLSALDIRESPDFNDAIAVLKEISAKVGSQHLLPEEESVVSQCWVMLSDALDRKLLEADCLESSLRDTPCVPNKQRQLYKPSWMYFEDRPSLADKFPEQFKGNAIERLERAWTAMEAAGVRPLSQAVHCLLVDTMNPQADKKMKDRITQRAILIKSICEDALNGVQRGKSGCSVDKILNTMELIRTDHLTVRWRLQAFNRDWPDTPPEQASAHWDCENEAIYFTQPADSDPPWSAIAREMTHAVAPEVRPASVSPGLKSILEANTDTEARNQLMELGIASIQNIEFEPVQGPAAESLDHEGTQEAYPEVIPVNEDEGKSGNGSVGVLSQDDMDRHDPDVPFAEKLYQEQTTNPSRSGQRQISLPGRGPRTDDSARRHTDESLREGRAGTNVSRTVTQWQPEEVARNLADEFRSMVHGDYGKRCQICSRSFTVRGGQLQVYVVHVVPPSEDERTNHFGDLLGLCGWHFALMRYGEWCFLDPDTNQHFTDSNGTVGWERMRDFVASRPKELDNIGNSYVGLPIRFSNVYQDWDSEPNTIQEEIRYSIPHWKYLCELLKT